MGKPRNALIYFAHATQLNGAKLEVGPRHIRGHGLTGQRYNGPGPLRKVAGIAAKLDLPALKPPRFPGKTWKGCDFEKGQGGGGLLVACGGTGRGAPPPPCAAPLAHLVFQGWSHATMVATGIWSTRAGGTRGMAQVVGPKPGLAQAGSGIAKHHPHPGQQKGGSNKGLGCAAGGQRGRAALVATGAAALGLRAGGWGLQVVVLR